jgi:hypothetical protein
VSGAKDIVEYFYREKGVLPDMKTLKRLWKRFLDPFIDILPALLSTDLKQMHENQHPGRRLLFQIFS